MPPAHLIEAAQHCYQQACLLELDALKPGNVSRYADGHGMTAEQFEISARVSAPALFSACQGVGERILNACRATRQAVGENTNLGIILLAAPIAEAVIKYCSTDNLDRHLKQILARLSVEDAKYCYQAIQIASPGGMGRIEDQDITSVPTISLLEAMRRAAEIDRIGYQYSNGFEDIFLYNLPTYKTYIKKWSSPRWAASAVFFSQWLRAPDSLIIRKQGLLKAREISDMIAPLANQVLMSDEPMQYKADLLSLDNDLKKLGINPGASADLTVATLFVAMLESVSDGDNQ